MDNWAMDLSVQFADAMAYTVVSESVDALAGTLACDRFRLSLLQEKSTDITKNSQKRNIISLSYKTEMALAVPMVEYHRPV